jgi:lipoate-protein ligase A
VGRWRVPPFAVAPAGAQLSLTEALWRATASGEAPPTLRWYGYSAPAVVLGVGQPAAAVDAGAAAAQGVAVVRRASGGTAVLADETMLALDVALPAEHPLAGRDVLEAYRWVGEAFLAALRAVAPPAAARLVLVDVSTARADQGAQRAARPGSPEALRGLACFGALSPYEVALVEPTGEAGSPPRKVVGLSQVRKRGVVLFQAGLYTRANGGRLAGVLALPPAARRTLGGELRRRMAGLDEVGLPAARLEALRGALVAAAGERLALACVSP